MIQVLTGLQGSGKTYYAAAEIWKHIRKMHQAEITGNEYKYKKIYTNIEGIINNKYVEQIDMSKLYKMWEWELKQYLNYEKRMNYSTPLDVEFIKNLKINPDIKKPNELIIDIDIHEERVPQAHADNIEKFENDDEQLLKFIQKEHDKIDMEYIDYVKPAFEKEGLTHCLVVVDEAHNYFGNPLKAPWLRLLSYHRHYDDQDYLLITQDSKMLSAKVTALTAYTMRAINPLMRWRKDIFTYNVYSGGWIAWNNSNKLETKSLKAKEHIFSLYESGGKKTQETYFFKVILKLLASLALVGGFGYWIISDYGHKDKTKTKVIKDENTTTSKKRFTPALAAAQDRKLVKFIMSNNKMVNLESGKKFNLKSFNQLTKDSAEAKTYEKNGDGSITIYYEIDKEKIKSLGIEDEDNQKHYSSSHTFL
jgi:hypothetical protein